MSMHKMVRNLPIFIIGYFRNKGQELEQVNWKHQHELMLYDKVSQSQHCWHLESKFFGGGGCSVFYAGYLAASLAILCVDTGCQYQVSFPQSWQVEMAPKFAKCLVGTDLPRLRTMLYGILYLWFCRSCF